MQDLSGNPIAGDFGSLKPLLTKAKENGLKLTIHCAEVSGRAEETREILDFDAVRRIGHGTFLDGISKGLNRIYIGNQRMFLQRHHNFGPCSKLKEFLSSAACPVM